MLWLLLNRRAGAVSRSSFCVLTCGTAATTHACESAPYLAYCSCLAGETCLLLVAFPRWWVELTLRVRAMNRLAMLARTQVRPIMHF